MMIAGLGIILIVVLAAPFLVKKIEEELEIFLLVMGCAAVTVTGLWSLHLVKEALSEPVKITLAVCVAGFLFKALQRPLARHVDVMVDGFGLKFFAFLVIAMLGILSSMLTAIIAALVLVEIVAALGLKRRDEVLLVVLACFSIGLGAALTPIGEPLSTIVIGKLKGEPYHAGFFFLAHHLWKYLIPGIIGFGIAGAAFMSEDRSPRDEAQPVREEPFRAIMLRTGKVYLFVVALVLLGAGFKPVIDAYISKLPYQ
ncbi:MAG: DUF1646 family protein, partial [Candidatus Omnitrophota bacterium]